MRWKIIFLLEIAVATTLIITFIGINGMEKITTQADEIIASSINEDYDQLISEQVECAISTIDSIYQLSVTGELTYEEAEIGRAHV